MINTAIIGVSGFGRTHYADLIRHRERGNVRIVGATIINPEEEREACATLKTIGCALFANCRKMLSELEGKIDVCFIPTGIALHAPMAIAAMRHGANCMIEKPAAPCVQDVRAMQDAERATGTFVAVGFQSMYQPEIQRIKRDLVAGKIGPLRCIKGIGLWPRDSVYYGRNHWAGRVRNDSGWILDSPFHNALAHYLNLICFFAGTSFERPAELDWIQASLFRCNPEIQNADSAVIRLATKDGVDILFYTTHGCEGTFGPVIEACGEKGTIRWTADQAVYTLADGSTETLPIDNGPIRDHLMHAVLGRVTDPSRFICGLDIAGTQVLAANGAQESSPIVPTPPARTERRDTEKGGHRFVCLGIDDAFRRMYADERLSDPALPWLKPGEPFFPRDYREFTGGKTAAT